MWPAPAGPPSTDGFPDDVRERFGRDLLGVIQVPRRGDDAPVVEHRLAATVADRAGDRASVERLRSLLLRRLHRPGPDPAGNAALRVIEAALLQMPRTEPAHGA